MAYQSVFERYEAKYVITRWQRAAVLEAMFPHMLPDDYGHTTIRNIYFDTDNYRLARRSLEKPVYKEKLRVRSYGEAQEQDEVFVELKKKYGDVVYKRRESLLLSEALKWLAEKSPFSKESPFSKATPFSKTMTFPKATPFPKATQIGNEIDYFFRFYQTLKPRIFLSYEREAFESLDGSDFRITFDENILARGKELSLSGEVWGEPLMAREKTLMEVKTSGAIPLWLTRTLAREKIYRESFSKYGAAYEKIVCKKASEGAEKVAIA